MINLNLININRKIKNRILKISFIYIFGIIIISCNQDTAHPQKNIEVVSELSNRYFYRNYHCFDFVKQCELEILKLIKYDTLIYVRSSQAHGKYEEIQGKLTKINDTIYFVKPFKHIVQGGNGDKPWHIEKDSIFFYCDSSLIGENLKIEYLNGKIENYKIYSTENRFWINEKYFNNDNERIFLSFGYKNPIVDETVEIVSIYSKIKYNIFFKSIKTTENFYIVVNDEYIKTLNISNEEQQCLGVKFKLKKMDIKTKLPGNRKIYK